MIDPYKALTQQLKRHEGFSSKPYRCTAGKLTIGYGRNLDDVGISQEEAEQLLINDIEKAARGLEQRLPCFPNLSPVRQGVLINMAFNLGVPGLMRFKRMLAAVQNGMWHVAAKEMLNSKWAKQVKGRATELAGQMRNG